MSLREEITKNLHLLILRYDADGEDRINIEGTSIAIINKVLDAAWPDIKTMQQALLEIRHAQNAGPGWYTNGEPGLKKQVRLWLDKGLKASESLNKLRGE